jgi:dimethylargininase
MLTAITRPISPGIGNCELTHLERQSIDLKLAEEQHHQYEAALASLGCHVIRLPVESDLPDSVFVEDIAVVLDELAIITRPGALSRRAEVPSVVAALQPFRELVYIQEPGTLDGGDVLCIDRVIYMGLTARSSDVAVQQFRAAVTPYGYEVRGVPVHGCLHLKSAVTQAAPGMLLINRNWVDAAYFEDFQWIDVDPAEPSAANGLLIGDMLVYPAEFSRTRQRMSAAGLKVMPVPASEVAKAEGALTCCSLIFNA